MIIEPNFDIPQADETISEAQASIYQQVVDSNHPGRALTGVRGDPASRPVDLFVCVQHVGYFGVKVLGDHYALDGQAWSLTDDQGRTPVENPIEQIKRAVKSLRNLVKEQLGPTIFVIPVLAFPDMPAYPAIHTWATRRHALAIWGADDFLNRLVAGDEDARTEVYYPPDAAEIERVATFLQPYIVPAEPGGPPPVPLPAAVPEFAEGTQVVIQRVETLNLNLHLTPEALQQGGLRLLHSD